MIKRTIAVAAALTLCVACSAKKSKDDSSAKGQGGDQSVDKTTTQKPDSPEKGTPGGDKVNVKKQELTAEHKAFDKQCRAGLEAAKALLPQLLGVTGERTLENTVEVYNDLARQMMLTNGAAGLFSEVHPDEQIRELARGCERDAAEFASKLSLNKDLYDAFAKLDTKSFDADTKRLIEHSLRDFRRAGVDRDDATRKRIEEIDAEETKLGQSFRQNVSEDVRFIEVASAADLAGMPEDFIKAHPPGENGKIRITTDYPDYLPFQSYADNNELRKQLYIEFKSRGSKSNGPILKQLLVLRAEKAKLLGYPNWAAYITEDKMIKSEKKAAEFLARVVTIAKKRGEKDYQELLARKRKVEPKAELVEDYEKVYYENKVKAESYAFDPQSVRPYFPYAQVEAGLLDITAKIYDIEYVKAADAELWHQDVKSFDVMRKGEKLGRIYLDMHPREGKYKHAAQFPYREGVKGKQLPEGVLVCNFPNPRTANGPALMEHGDVVTMFHEFGHLMHHTLGGHKRWIDQAGVATEWDFVEAPSQMFEEWAWNHETLKSFAKHHETGAEITPEVVESMRRAEKFGVGVATLQQMFYAAISLQFHTADPSTLDMLALVKKLQAEYTPFRYVEGTQFHLNFTHLHGYSAIYYTYMWSLVIAKDLLTPFKQHGLMNTEWTYRYRDRILAPGGTKDAADLVEDFLGREYNFKAFEEYLGG